ncbi:MAG: helix-turn-helix domain-containing protein [Agathobaculum desmolans]|uniref:helix-turn-helix domain-containing protein n=1 Tax=Agathobaculum desmolans TaxID=39484 RepID=UPI003990E388
MSELGNKEILAENLKRFMVKRGVTRRDICEDLGIKYTTLTDWINAKTYPRIDKIELLAEYFGISKADLIEQPKPIGEVFTIGEIFDIKLRELQGEDPENIGKEYTAKHEKERQENKNHYLKSERMVARQEATSGQWMARLRSEKDVLSKEEQELNHAIDTESLLEDVAKLQKNFVDLMLSELSFAGLCGVVSPQEVKNMSDILSIHQTVTMRLEECSDTVRKEFYKMYSEYMPLLLYAVQNMHYDILGEIPYKERCRLAKYGQEIFAK